MDTVKKTSDLRAKELNSLPVMKEFKILACNTQWNPDGKTWCELYNKSNRKRIRIKTNIVFERPEFIKDNNSYIKELLRKNDII